MRGASARIQRLYSLFLPPRSAMTRRCVSLHLLANDSFRLVAILAGPLALASLDQNVTIVAIRRSATVESRLGVGATIAEGRTDRAEGTLVPKTDPGTTNAARDLRSGFSGHRGAGLTMHRRLRRQLEEALGQDESSPHLRRLLRKIDKEYRRADGDRASLQHALALLSNLLKRQPDAERTRVVSPRARSVSRLFDQAPFAAVLCDVDRKVTAWNTAAERLFGIPHAEAVGRGPLVLGLARHAADGRQVAPGLSPR